MDPLVTPNWILMNKDLILCSFLLTSVYLILLITTCHSLFTLGPIVKNRKTQSDVERYKAIGTRQSQIWLSFALRSLVFQIIELFGFPIGYNDEFEIFVKKNRYKSKSLQFNPLGPMLTTMKKILKISFFKIPKSPNAILWGSLGRKFRRRLSAAICKSSVLNLLP